MPRLFVAIYPDPVVRDALAALATPLRGFRWTPPEQLHLTLRFLGELDDDATARAEAALATVHVESFLLEPADVGIFPPRGPAGVVWIGFGTAHPRLFQLRQRVDDALLAAGVPLELRPFEAHLTVARVREASGGTVAEFVKRHRDFAAPPWRVPSFSLMESRLTPVGAEHTARRVYPLGKV